MSNPNARGQIGNRGGGRLGYTYEKDQLMKLRRFIDKMLAKMEAIDNGKVSDKEIEKFKLFLPVALKAMDKLHANKQQWNIPLGDGDGQNNLSELTVFFRAVAQPKKDEPSGQTSLPSSPEIVQE